MDGNERAIHWPGVGKSGLAEYSLGVEDPRTVEDFKRLFATSGGWLNCGRPSRHWSRLRSGY